MLRSAGSPNQADSSLSEAFPADSGPTVIHLEHVTKDYGSLRALDDVNLRIGPGVTGLLGPNGAGKSTLIKVLLGLVSVRHGTGTILGRSLWDRQWIRSQVGYMPEDDCYIPGLSGVEMVQFMVRLSGRANVEGLRRSHEILDYCGMGQERYRDVATYSNGMRQKLKFAQAIVHDPQLLILDEPTAGLDPDERQAMLNRVRKLASDANKTVILSTHILPDVQSVCENVVIMAKGRVSLAQNLDQLRQTSNPAHVLRVMGQVDAFLEVVRGAGYEVDHDEQGTVTIHRLADDEVGRVWLWAEEAGATVFSAVVARNSLEDIFLNAIRETNRADS